MAVPHYAMSGGTLIVPAADEILLDRHAALGPVDPQLGLPVKVGVPALERSLMDLYPQPRGREPGVEYVPGGRPLPGLPPGRDVSRPRR